MSLWNPEFDDLDPEDFLYDIVKKFRQENPPPENPLGIEGSNPDTDPGISYNNAPMDYFLYYGVKDLTPEQRQERLENAYYSRLLDIAKDTTKERAKDYYDRVKAGQSIPDEVIGQIHDERLSPGMEAKARKAAEDNFIHGLRLGTLEAYHDNRVETLINREPEPSLYADTNRWRMNPAVEQVLSEKRGYDGNYYSWFFHKEGADREKELDRLFFQTVRDGINEGIPEAEILDRAEEVCTGDNLNRARLKNIVRTETTRAFNEGKILENERIARELEAEGFVSGIVAYMFHAVIDGKEWEGCKARHRLLIDAKDKELLRANTPPLHYFCRSRITGISKRKLEMYGGQAQLEADKKKLKEAPVFKWRYTPDKEIFDEGNLEE